MTAPGPHELPRIVTSGDSGGAKLKILTGTTALFLTMTFATAGARPTPTSPKSSGVGVKTSDVLPIPPRSRFPLRPTSLSMEFPDWVHDSEKSAKHAVENRRV